MANPPTNLSPSELFSALCIMPRPFVIVDFPRAVKGVPIGQLTIRILNQAEQHKVAAEAERYTRKVLAADIPKTGDARRGYDDLYSNEAAVQILFQCCRRAEDPDAPLFPSADAIRSALTADEVGVLVMAYYQAQRSLGPIASQMSETEVDAWLLRLQEGSRGLPFMLLSPEALTDLSASLARRLSSFTTAISSSGLPSDEPTPQSPQREDGGA